MPNYCSYELIAKGNKKTLEELVALLNESYDYSKVDEEYCLYNPESKYETKLISIAKEVTEKINGQKEKGDDILYREFVKMSNDQFKDLESLIRANENSSFAKKYEEIENYFKSLTNLEIDDNYPLREQKPHLFRVFDAYAEWSNDNEVRICGYCAWTVSKCMLDGQFSYYNDWKEEGCTIPKNFNGTTLNAFCEKHPDIEIEIISEQLDCCFTEHYYFKDGNLEVNEFDEIKIDDDGNISSDADYVEANNDEGTPFLEYNFMCL